MTTQPSRSQPSGTGREHPDDAWPPTDTPDSRMTGEGGPPPPDDQEPGKEADAAADPADDED
ncbi:hypothetical protein AB0442_09560 [Kitasatospora sp. NPDC085895]|uniref:hypothetical protein n=1 Tax=Kitasatospora sp. NPDC085895 TaxID=3155057 RepID=UPI00344E6D62